MKRWKRLVWIPCAALLLLLAALKWGLLTENALLGTWRGEWDITGTHWTGVIEFDGNGQYHAQYYAEGGPTESSSGVYERKWFRVICRDDTAFTHQGMDKRWTYRFGSLHNGTAVLTKEK